MSGKIAGWASILCCVWLGGASVSARPVHGIPAPAVSVSDTVPASRMETPPSWLHRSLHIWRDRHYRDSVLSKLSRNNEPPPGDDSSMMKSEKVFLPETGRRIRNIYFKRVQVFGPNNINDTTFKTSSRLINLANDMHYDSRMWVIRQSLFFSPGDTINAYELADNERYLRNLPFIQDARIYVVNSTGVSDSVDINIVTKDVFEYGGELSELSTSNAKASIYNNDLFGAGQSLTLGFLWDKTYQPTTGTQVQYKKSNIAGSFIDGAIGYTLLGNNTPIDTNTYVGSYYVSLNRPLFRSVTSVIGGLYVANNFSMNIHNLNDSAYRNYKYNIVDVWAGYNFRPQQKKNGVLSSRPSLAVLLRHYNLFFTEQPTPTQYKYDQTYNNRRYLLGEFAIYKQDFFKSQYFFGWGRTEDIPLGYNIGLYAGEETWVQRQRSYTGINLQKYWVTPLKGLLNTTFGISSFWHVGTGSEDAVIHAEIDYYSRLFNFKFGRLRQFVTLNYLDCPNPFFYKPLDINMPFGIYGIENTQINGFQRMNMRSQTMYYSPLKIYGFKFNFTATAQTSQLSTMTERDLLNSRLYAGFGLGCDIRNENLTFNTFRIDGNYYPYIPPGAGTRRNFFFEITTITDFRFNIFPLSSPSYLNFR